MDVARFRFGVVITFGSLALSACSDPPKQQVFVEPSPAKAACLSAAMPTQFMVKWKDGTTTVEKSVDKETFLKEVVEPNSEDIEYAEHDYAVKLDEPQVISVNVPQEATVDWGQTKISANEVWSAGFQGQGVVVAVIDSGVDIEHPQIKNRLAVNEAEIPSNGLDDDGNGLIDDISGFDFNQNTGVVRDGSGHGTHVAGVMIADHAAGPIKGIAPKAKLLPLDFMSNSGVGSISDAIRAMKYAASRGAKVINASWGGAPCSKSLQDAIDDVGDKGALFVAAAGNSGVDLDETPEFPAAFGRETQITVGASSVRDYMEGFSNYSYGLVNIMAPGSYITSTYPGGNTAVLSGTSMASPFVAGAAAVLWSARPQASVAQIRSILLRSVDPGNFQVSSRGRLNLKKALALLIAEVP